MASLNEPLYNALPTTTPSTPSFSSGKNLQMSSRVATPSENRHEGRTRAIDHDGTQCRRATQKSPTEDLQAEM
jgi:hypothetical protein